MEEVLGGALRQSRRNLLQLEELSKQVIERAALLWGLLEAGRGRYAAPTPCMHGAESLPSSIQVKGAHERESKQFERLHFAYQKAQSDAAYGVLPHEGIIL